MINLPWEDDPMVAYLTDAQCWLQLISNKGYVSLQVNNVLLTPAHNWIHDCILDWTWKWDPSLNMNTVLLNLRQGIIAMFSGGVAGRF